MKFHWSQRYGTYNWDFQWLFTVFQRQYTDSPERVQNSKLISNHSRTFETHWRMQERRIIRAHVETIISPLVEWTHGHSFVYYCISRNGAATCSSATFPRRAREMSRRHICARCAIVATQSWNLPSNFGAEIDFPPRIVVWKRETSSGSAPNAGQLNGLIVCEIETRREKERERDG